MSKSMWARPTGLTDATRQQLWVPPQSAEDRPGFSICAEPDVKTHKMIAFKFRVDDNEHHWLGQLIHSKKGEDLDEKGADGVSMRDQIHILLTGLVERTLGSFLFQDSDEMQGRVFIDEWPEQDHSEERWNRFVRHVPPKRDSIQVVDIV